jgi:hypothetical protein
MSIEVTLLGAFEELITLHSEERACLWILAVRV